MPRDVPDTPSETQSESSEFDIARTTDSVSLRRYRACGLSLQNGQLLAYGLYLLAQKREGVQRDLFAVLH